MHGGFGTGFIDYLCLYISAAYASVEYFVQ